MVLIALSGWRQEQEKRRSQEAGLAYHLDQPAESVDLEKLPGSFRAATG